MTRESVWIVIPNNDGHAWLAGCLPTLFPTRPTVNVDATVLVVDNASRDGSLAYLDESFPQVERLALEMNLGFVQATNLGVLKALSAGADAVVLLNNDVRCGRGWLDALTAVARRRPDFGVLGAWQTDFDGEPSPRTKAIVRG
ncbi:MAG: glycosyltransferase, partial [Planctomycetia bacterium]